MYKTFYAIHRITISHTKPIKQKRKIKQWDRERKRDTERKVELFTHRKGKLDYFEIIIFGEISF